MVYLSIFLAVIPILTYLIILWRLDKYEREPIKLILFHFFWGMTGSVLFSIIFSSIVNNIAKNQISNQEIISLFSTVFTAPVIEEAFKGVFLIFTFRKIDFNNLTDGIVYGGSIGLGFGLTENLLYFLFTTENIYDLLQLAMIRNLFSVSTHFIASASFGAMVAISKFKSLSSKIILIIMGYAIAVVIHSIWNFTVSFNFTFLVGILFILISLLVIFVIFQVSLAFERNILLYEMNDEIQNGRLLDKYASIIPNYKLRNTEGWIKEKYRKDYIKLATNLAFRKNELKNIKQHELRDKYEKNIQLIRAQLNQLEIEAEGLSRID